MPLIQQITPEVLSWIAIQARAGHSRDAVAQALRASGWDEQVALHAIERTLRGDARVGDASVALPVPQLLSIDSTGVIRSSDREVAVITEMRAPRLIVFGSLLSNDECEHLIESARPGLARSTTVDEWDGGSATAEERTSHGAFLPRGSTDFLGVIEARISEILQWPVVQGEDMQVLRYRTGEEFLPHHDYFDPNVPGSERHMAHGGQRVATLIMYLNTPEKGGRTEFPCAGLEVSAIRGNAVFFSYDRPVEETLTLHGGRPVIQGEKWIATKWFRESPID